MQLLMTSVESIQQDTYRLISYEKQLAKNNQAKQQLIQKRVSSNTFFSPGLIGLTPSLLPCLPHLCVRLVLFALK